MRVAALSLAGMQPAGPEQYREDLAVLLKELAVRLAVLPGYTSLRLWACIGGASLPPDAGFADALSLFRKEAARWNAEFLGLHEALAKELDIYLVAGDTLEKAGGRLYRTAYCFDPRGAVCAAQRQTHLDREERALGLSRGTELSLFEVDGMKAGLVVGADARHPEVGRILALQGADILAHAGALQAGPDSMHRQLAGMWAQVQQNGCWAVEAQQHGAVCGRLFGARCAVIGPCEATEDLSGYIALGPAGREAAAARLNREDRARAAESFPVLRQINPGAYGELSQ